MGAATPLSARICSSRAWPDGSGAAARTGSSTDAAVAPAVVKTKFAEALFSGREDAVSKQYPVGRLGVPEDIGEAAAYLLGDSAGWVTGQTLVLDGGALSRGPI